MNKLYLNKLVEVCVNNYDARFENNKPNLIASILDINTHNKNSYVVEETNYESIASYANNLNKVITKNDDNKPKFFNYYELQKIFNIKNNEYILLNYHTESGEIFCESIIHPVLLMVTGEYYYLCQNQSDNRRNYLKSFVEKHHILNNNNFVIPNDSINIMQTNTIYKLSKIFALNIIVINTLTNKIELYITQMPETIVLCKIENNYYAVENFDNKMYKTNSLFIQTLLSHKDLQRFKEENDKNLTETIPNNSLSQSNKLSQNNNNNDNNNNKKLPQTKNNNKKLLQNNDDYNNDNDNNDNNDKNNNNNNNNNNNTNTNNDNKNLSQKTLTTQNKIPTKLSSINELPSEEITTQSKIQLISSELYEQLINSSDKHAYVETENKTNDNNNIFVSDAIVNIMPKMINQNTIKNKKTNKDVFMTTLPTEQSDIFEKTDIVNVNEIKKSAKATSSLSELQQIAIKLNICIVKGSTKQGAPKNKTRNELLEEITR